MPLTLRLSKGSRLTWQEGDDNFAGLASGALLEAGALAAKVFTSLTLSGVLLASDGNIGAPGIAFANQSNLGIYRSGSNTIGITAGSAAMLWDNAVLYLQTNGAQIYMGATNDLQLHREAADRLAMKRGANPQTFRMYNTFTDPANFEVFEMIWSGSAVHLETLAAGSGITRNLHIGAGGGGGQMWVFNTTGVFRPFQDASHDIGTPTLRVRNGYFSTRVTIGGGIDSEALRLIAADSVGDGYMTFYSSNGSTRRGYIGYGSTTNNSLQIANDSVDEHLFLLTAGSSNIVFNIASTDAGRIGREGQYGIINLMAGQATGISSTGFNVAAGSSDQTLYLNSPGAIQMRVANVTGLILTSGGVNYLSVQGATSGQAPNLTADGGDTNINLALSSKGSGSIYLFTRDVDTTGRLQVAINHTAAADRFVILTGANGGSPVVGTSNGSLVLAPAGSTSLVINPVASSVNWVEIQGSATGIRPVLQSNGNDTNIGMFYSVKGTGNHDFFTGGGTVQQFQIAHVASAVNYLVATGAITTLTPRLSAAGGDTNVGIQFFGKGSGGHEFFVNGVSTVRIIAASSNVNRIELQGSPTGIPVSVNSQGSDTNIDFEILSKGTGNINLSPGSGDVRWNKALVALGGGAAATLGTIGGSGPATAAQNTWMRVRDSGGTPFWVPAWK